MKKKWILCMVAVLCIAVALLGCGKKNVGTPEDNAVVEDPARTHIPHSHYLTLQMQIQGLSLLLLYQD